MTSDRTSASKTSPSATSFPRRPRMSLFHSSNQNTWMFTKNTVTRHSRYKSDCTSCSVMAAVSCSKRQRQASSTLTSRIHPSHPSRKNPSARTTSQVRPGVQCLEPLPRVTKNVVRSVSQWLLRASGPFWSYLVSAMGSPILMERPEMCFSLRIFRWRGRVLPH
jgi:hypothetical protein